LVSDEYSSKELKLPGVLKLPRGNSSPFISNPNDNQKRRKKLKKINLTVNWGQNYPLKVNP